MDFDQPNQKPIPWKTIIIIVAGFALAIAIVVVVFILTRGREVAQKQTKQPVSVETAAKLLDPCAKVPNPEICRIQIAKDRAKDEKKPDACKTLSSTQKDDCLWGVAKSAEDSSICSEIKTSGWAQRCADGVIKDLAIGKNDVAICDKIQDESVKAMCKEEAVDPDFDGLTTDEETNKYHTDPRNADTDGDGYKDGAEIKNGHDPLKK